ncbi:MAG: XRE family transcriptional regulator [Scytonema sp. PMC 1069.18]|nr:XRE family transcriptional regulator [Scytonema sp. PMC 1069.18]MEC4883732.1 XRE family transcriptional regulator [Scytonema sp. PMC 1070.18]
MEKDKLTSVNSKKEVTMIDIEHIATLKWTQDQAQKLQSLRGKMSRRQLEEKTEELGLKVAHQYIQQLEQPHLFTKRLKSDTLTVSVEVVKTLCAALETDITNFFNSAKIITVVAS